MVTNDTIAELDRAGLRSFGLMTGGIVAVLFGLFFPWLLGRGWPLWPWILFALLASLGLVRPEWLRPIYRGWMRFGLLANKVTTPLVLGLVFFLVISPMSLLRRISGKDAMARRFDPAASSYRVTSSLRSPENLEKPF